MERTAAALLVTTLFGTGTPAPGFIKTGLTHVFDANKRLIGHITSRC
jgi:hypothetical protein